MNSQTLPLPNPGDWMGAPAAAALLDVGERQVRRLVAAGVLHGYQIIGVKSLMLWAPEVREVAAARHRIRPARCA